MLLLRTRLTIHALDEGQCMEAAFREYMYRNRVSFGSHNSSDGIGVSGRRAIDFLHSFNAKVCIDNVWGLGGEATLCSER